MAKVIRTLDFLPEIFQTPSNQQFLSATLDQLVNPPNLQKLQGFVGNRFGYGVNANDHYVTEPDATRTDYQLDPGVVFTKPGTSTATDFISYPGILNAINTAGGLANNNSRLFNSQFYSWDSFTNLDPLINFNQYYWLPQGPPAVTVSAATVFATEDYAVTAEPNGYAIAPVGSGTGSINPTLTLLRGGIYNFYVNQSTQFWIQGQPGISGTSITNPNQSVRDIYGVDNNGIESGVVTFTVPAADAQNQYILPGNNTVSLVSNVPYANINGQPVSILGNIDGVTSMNGMALMFYNTGLANEQAYTNSFYDNQQNGQAYDVNDTVTTTAQTIAITATSATGNLITCSSTADLVVGQAVTFTGNQIGNLVPSPPNATTLYFVASIASGTEFTVSLQLNGTELAMQNATGSMICNINQGQFMQGYASTVNTNFYRITYVGEPSAPIISLSVIGQIPYDQKITAVYGNTYGGLDFYLDSATSTIKEVPYISALLTTLYYQDGTNPARAGIINIIDNNITNQIDVETEILGKKNYTSTNGVVFTNGLKVQFNGDVVPASYLSGQYYVQGVGTAIQLLPVSNFIVPESFTGTIYSLWDIGSWDIGNFGDTLYIPTTPEYITIAREAINRNPWSRGNRWFHIDVITATAQYNNDPTIVDVYATQTNKALRPIIEFYPNLELFDYGTQGVAPVDFIDFRTTDCLNEVAGQLVYYPDVDVYTTYDGSIYPLTPTSASLTILASKVTGTLALGMYVSDSLNMLPADATITDISGTTTLTILVEWADAATVTSETNVSFIANPTRNESYALFPEARVIFAADPNQKTKIFIASFSTLSPNSQPVITLTEAPDGQLVEDNVVAVIRGYNYQGYSFWYNGADWVQAQQKTTINQAPLFDVFDSNGISFGNPLYYSGTSFVGSRLFSYAIGTGVDDAVLGFPLKYSSVNNIGDIRFDVSFNSETFTYANNFTPTTGNVNTGFVYNSTGLVSYERLLGWQTAAGPSVQYQVFEFKYVQNFVIPANTFTLDVAPTTADPWPILEVYVNNILQPATNYTVTTTSNSTTVVINISVAVTKTLVQILVLSDQVSKTAFYQIPINLSNNPFNTDITATNVGDIRRQYASIFNNCPTTSGQVFGPNNYRDLGNIVPYGNVIIQNSASLVLPATFLRNLNYNLFDSLAYNSKKYVEYKNLIAYTVNSYPFDQRYNPAYVLDTAIDLITATKDNSQSFFWSDMLPAKAPYASNVYSFNSNLQQTIYPLTQTYNFDTSNYNSVLVYLSRTVQAVTTTKQLVINQDYIVSATAPSLEINIALQPGDVVTINEYNQTYGSYVPNTPTKLGLYPAFIPEVVLDTGYQQPTYFIKGHDGSYTKLYGDYIAATDTLIDFRDQALLEFEKRVYNNLKLSNTIPVQAYEVTPGFFRNTGYSYDEWLEIYTPGFLNWVGQNRLNYQQQLYNSYNQYTWNYRNTTNKVDNTQIGIGYWRGIYSYFYDTTTPDKTPWEMLGYANEPSWWTTRYGPAPYTSNNLILWGDLAAGLDWNNGDPVVIPKAVRNGLLEVLPVDSQGNLISPFDSVVASYYTPSFNTNWVVGDDGPVEFSYRRSSSWPFDLMRILALTKPAEFFSLGVWVDDYKYNVEFNQYLVNGRSHLVPNQIPVYGSGTPVTSYINWIVDYQKQYGINATTAITNILNNLDVRLVYRMAGFSDQNLLNFYIQSTNPNSNNSSLLIPNESYQVLLYSNPPYGILQYSSVVVQITAQGQYAVFGNSQSAAYFATYLPKNDGQTSTIKVDQIAVKVASNYTTTEEVIPYGTIFQTPQAVAQFLTSYGAYLEANGATYQYQVGSISVNWSQMVAEFLYWVQIGWQPGAVTTLNPAAYELTINKEDQIVQPLSVQGANFVLNQNLYPIKNSDLSIIRNGTSFSVAPLNKGDTISYGQFNLSNFENACVFDNYTLFGDTINDLVIGLRQNRIYLRGAKTADWNGTYTASGFIINQNNVTQWDPAAKYTKGQIVLYKNQYWIAQDIIQPNATFQQKYWLLSNYKMIQTGLLPNSSTNSLDSTYYYSSDQSALNSDSNLLGYSLIGYRPRDYTATADLTDVSQINVYKNLIKTKGSTNAVSAFKGATLPHGGIDYNVYENWSILTSNFGGVLNNSFVQFKLNASELMGNPFIAGLTNGTSITGVEQEVPLYSLYNYNYSAPPTSPNVLPTLSQYVPSTLFPDAGYVNFNDVKMSAYFYSQLSTAINEQGVIIPLTSFYVGDYVWLANYLNQWNVYTPTSLGQVISVASNLNNTCTVTFSQVHELKQYDLIAIANFNSAVNGYYTVNNVVNNYQVTILLTLTSSSRQIVGQGVGMYLSPQRVATPAKIANLPLDASEFVDNTVWVDTNSDGGWAVYRKTINYQLQEEITQPLNDSLSFGAAVAYNSNLTGYLIGDPNLSRVYRYDYNPTTGGYDIAQTLLGTDVSFGSTIVNEQNVYVVAQPYNYAAIFIYVLNDSTLSNQLLAYQDPLTFGYEGQSTGSAIALSGDTNWLYIGIPELNQVRIYRRENVLTNADEGVIYNETYTITSLGTTDFTFMTNDPIENKVGMTFVANDDYFDFGTGTATRCTYVYSTYIDGGAFLENPTAKFGFSLATDYYGDTLVVGAPDVSYGDKSNWGSTYVYDRSVQNFVAQYTYPSASNPAPTFQLVQSFDPNQLYVSVNSIVVQNSNYTIVDTTLTYTGPLTAGDIISVSGNIFTLVQTLTTQSTPQIGVQFGLSVDTTTHANEIIVGAPFELTQQLVEGAVYRFTNGGGSYGQVFGTTPVATTAARTVLINGFAVIIPNGADATVAANTINSANVINVQAKATATNTLIISLIDVALAQANEKLLITTLDDQALVELGIQPYTQTQVVLCPHTDGPTQFGTTVKFNESGSFVASAPVGTRYEDTTFDVLDYPDNDTIFDNNTTQFIDTFPNAGAVYMFDYLGVYNENIYNSGAFVYAQSVNAPNLTYGPQPRYGTALDFVDNTVVVGTPNMYNYDISATALTAGVTYTIVFVGTTDFTALGAKSNTVGVTFVATGAGTGSGVATDGELVSYGQVISYTNASGVQDWEVYRQTSAIVDNSRIGYMQIFSAQTNNTIVNLDYFDPLQNKLLGAVAENIDVISNADPAGYNNNATQPSIIWGSEHVGKTWFNTSNVRFINYHQDDVVYNSKYWGAVFPGSDVAIYSWIASNTPPANYQGPGTPYNNNLYTVETTLNASRSAVPVYYFWVRNSNIIFTKQGKTLSDTVLESYINSPQNSGISYLAPVLPSVFSVYNSQQYLNGTDSVLNVGYSTGATDDPHHSEHSLIRENYAEDFLPGLPTLVNINPSSLYQRLLYSLAGTTIFAANPPDVVSASALVKGQSYQIATLGTTDFMLVGAQSNTVGLVFVATGPGTGTGTALFVATTQVVPNPFLPIRVQSGISPRPQQSFFLDRLTALQNYIEFANTIMLEYPITEIREGATYLYASGEFYNTADYWEFINWWAPGYSNSIRSSLVVPIYADLSTLSVASGTIVKVQANGAGVSEWYIFEVGNIWKRIGVQNGTIQFKSSLWDYSGSGIGWDGSFYGTTAYDTYPNEETYWIVRALTEQIYTNDLLLYRNRSLILLFQYVQSESVSSQNYLTWLNKTSLVDVSHNIRALLPYENYQSDNQDFLAGYLGEALPYHVFIKQFTYVYTGSELWRGNVSDFDLPAQYNTTIDQFVSPQLVYSDADNIYTYLPSSPIWQEPEYNQWFRNYGVSLTGQTDFLITTLVNYLNLGTSTIVVANASGFPLNGVITIGIEKIAYSTVDRARNTLTNLIRGYGGTPISVHIPSENIYIDLPAVVVLNSGRGYVNPPRVTAYIDTSIYPAPDVPAQLEAIMSLDTVVGVNVINPGNGYAVLPEIVIDFSEQLAFASSGVNVLFNTILIYAPLLATGDLVKYIMSPNGAAVGGLQNNQWYYVNVLQTSPSVIVALYTTYADALNDTNRVSIYNQGSGSNHTLNLGARASTITSASPIRENSITLKFDRTSYNSQVSDWTADAYYGSSFAGDLLNQTQVSSSTIRLESTNPDINQIYASARGCLFEIADVNNNQQVEWSSFVRTVFATEAATNSINLLTSSDITNASGSTVGMTVGMPVRFSGDVGSSGLEADKVYYVVYILSLTNFTISETIGGSTVRLYDYSPSDLGCTVAQIINTAILTVDYPGIRTVTSTTANNFSNRGYLTIPINPVGTGGTQDFYVGLPIFFVGNVFGGVISNQTYYVNTVLDNQNFTISASTDIATVQVNSTSGITNYVNLISTESLLVNAPIVINNMTIAGMPVTNFGNIEPSVIYYVNQIIDGYNITISTEFNGAVFALTTVPATSTINATSLIVGVTYTIVTVGTTDFTLVGAASNDVGVSFVATGVGTGNGTASCRSSATLVNQSNTLALTTATGNMSINLSLPVSPGQVNGQQFTLYKTSQEYYPIVVSVLSNQLTSILTATRATLNYVAVSTTAGFYVNMPLQVDSNIGGLSTGTTYYITSIGSISVEVTNTSSSTNELTCSDTTELYAYMPIIFSGTGLGGVTIGQTYYVSAVVDSSRFTISATPGGSVLVLTTDNGSMSGQGTSYLILSTSVSGSAVALSDAYGPANITQTPTDAIDIAIGYIVGGYYVNFINSGQGYAINNTFTVDGTEVGGVSPLNDVTIVVNSIDSYGAITSVNVSGTVPANSDQYYLRVTGANTFEVYANPLMTVPVSGIDFPYTGFTTAAVSYIYSADNSILIEDTSVFAVNDPVVFTGNVQTAITNLVAGQTYYVAEILSSTALTVSEALGSSTVNMTTTTPVDFTIAKIGSFAFLPEPFYFNQSIVRFNHQLYRCIVSNNDSEFIYGKWELLDSGNRDINALDRIVGYYQPTVNMPGLAYYQSGSLQAGTPSIDFSQLLTGTTYPNSTYLGNPFQPSQQLLIDVELQDRPFSPETLPPIYDVQGSAFTAGFGPEELVAGVVSDNLTMIVNTLPGTNWDPAQYAHTGYNVVSLQLTPTSSTQTTYSFAGAVQVPAQIAVYVIDYASKVGTGIYNEIDYTVDWINNTVILNTPISFTPTLDSLRIDVYEVGNGFEMVKSNTKLNPIIDDAVTGFSVIELNCQYSGTISNGNGVVRPNTQPIQTNATATISSINSIVVDDVSSFILNGPIQFLGSTFGNIVEGTVYYVKTISQVTGSITVSETYDPTYGIAGATFILTDATGIMTCVIEAGNGVFWSPPIVYHNGTRLISGTINFVTATESSTNVILCNSTSGLIVDTPITFSDTMFGGVAPLTTYYIKQIVDFNNFTISETPSGAVVALSDAFGGASFVTNDYAVALAADKISAQLVFASQYNVAVDYIAYTLFGETRPVQFGYTIPETQLFTGDGVQATFALTNYVDGDNPTNAIVEIDGLRQTASLYTIDFGASTITFATAPANLSTIAVTSYNLTDNQYLNTQYGIHSNTFTVVNTWEQTNVDRLWVTLNGYRVPSSLLTIAPGNNVTILLPVTLSDEVIVTSMVSSATPSQMTYYLNVNQIQIPTVYNVNTTRTWLVQTLESTDSVIYVNDVSQIVETTVQTVAAPAAVDGVISIGLTADKRTLNSVTVFNNTTSELLPNNYYFVSLVDISPTLQITSGVTVGDSLTINSLQGNLIYINGEQIKFGVADFANNTLSQLQRGANGTGRQTLIPKYTLALGLLYSTRLPEKYYNVTWNPIPGIYNTSQGDPLQLAQTTPANFLNTGQ